LAFYPPALFVVDVGCPAPEALEASSFGPGAVGAAAIAGFEDGPSVDLTGGAPAAPVGWSLFGLAAAGSAAFDYIIRLFYI